MNRISQTTPNNEPTEAIIEKFIKENCVSEMVRSVCKSKSKGIPNIRIMRFLMSVVFSGRSINQNIGGNTENGFEKDTVYRFLSGCNGWFNALPKVASSLIQKFFNPLTDEQRDNVLIIDDTAFNRERSKKVELLARTFDHARQKFSKGFRMLSMGWSDGNSFVPVTYALLSTGNDKNLLCDSHKQDKMTENQKIIRTVSRKKATDVVIDMVRTAKRSGIEAKYVLFDSWFCLPSEVIAVHKEGYDVIGMVKKSSKIHFEINGKCMSVKQIYRSHKKKRGLAHIRLVVDAQACHTDENGAETKIPVKLVFISQNSNRKNYLVLLSTDPSIDAQKICSLYARRWETECFYKVCKSVLHLAKGCQCRNFDSISTHTAIVLLQYMMLSQQKRICEDERTLGELFFAVVDQMDEMSFEQAITVIVQKLFDEIITIEGMSVDLKMQVVQVFLHALPQHITQHLNFAA